MNHRQTGFTLIEVLIAMLILGIGLLGLAGLQATGMRSNNSANLRSQATLLAYDIGDRMRANLAGFQGGDYNKPTATNNTCTWKGSTPSKCTAKQMAQHDAFEWNAAIARDLPQGVGVVCRDSTPNDGTKASQACDNSGNLYAVKLWWVDGFDAAGDPEVERFATGFRP